jgi:phosphatidylglycerophosphate synthase
MQQSVSDNSQQVVELLTTLRQQRFSPSAWWHFLKRCWDMSCATANAHPALKRSWLHHTILMAILTVCILAMTGVFEGPEVMLRLLPGFLFCMLWQQSDLFWHLGLHYHTQTGQLFQNVGMANILTGMRGMSASLLIGRLAGGVSTPLSWLALILFLIGVVTDVLDGQVARYTKTQSKLGQIIDSEADFCFYTTLTVLLMQSGILPLWFAVTIMLRFLLPLLATVICYFIFARSILFGSTIWGKYAGIMLCLSFFVMLIPPHFTPITHMYGLPLLIITTVLLIIAPSIQLLKNKAILRRS